MNKIYKKKNLKVIISIALLFVIVLSTVIFACVNIKHDEAILNIDEITEKGISVTDVQVVSAQVEEDNIVKDFAGNEYIVSESNAGYIISHKETMLVLESSEDAVSPFDGYNLDTSYYAGPSQFYYSNNEVIYSLPLKEELSVTAEIIEYCEELNDFMLNQKTEREAVPSTQAAVGYKRRVGVDNADWWNDLNTNAYNMFGTCGYVAAASVAAYYTTTVMGSSMMDYDYIDNSGGYSKDFHDLLRSYGSENLSNAYTIKKVMKAYLEEYTKYFNDYKVTHTTKSGMWTYNSWMMDSIEANRPVIVFGSFNDPQPGHTENTDHAIVLYLGSKSHDNVYSYTAHYGWGPSYNAVNITNNLADFFVKSSYIFYDEYV